MLISTKVFRLAQSLPHPAIMVSLCLLGVSQQAFSTANGQEIFVLVQEPASAEIDLIETTEEASQVIISTDVKVIAADDSAVSDGETGQPSPASTSFLEGIESDNAAAIVESSDFLGGPSEELRPVIDRLHESAESVELAVEETSPPAPGGQSGSFLKIGDSKIYDIQSSTALDNEVSSSSDLEVPHDLHSRSPSLAELRRQRAAEIARLRSLKLQQQIRSGYSPLRPRWNAIPMMSSRYSRPVIYVPVY